MLTANQYKTITEMLALGEPVNRIADCAGVTAHTVRNVQYKRVKAPAEKRRDAGSSKIPYIDRFLDVAFQEYLSQGKRKGNLAACIDNAKARLVAEGVFVPASAATLRRHVQRAYHDEAWPTRWDARKHQHNAQSVLPKLHYDYWKLVGFNDYWVIDGRKSDRWIAEPYTQPQGFYVMELKTGAIIHASFKTEAFNAFDVIKILLHLALSYGPPNMGILVDNGMEQIGKDNVLAMESFWPWELIEMYRQGRGLRGFHDLFPRRVSPIVNSLPRIPTAFGKARIESAFAFLQRRNDAFLGGDGYMGGDRNEAVHRTLTRVPKPEKWQTFDRFVAEQMWFFTATEPNDGLLPYHCIERPQALRSFTRECGVAPTLANALAYCTSDYTPNMLPTENYYRVAYYSLPKWTGKTVTHLGQVSFQHRGDLYQYKCDALDWRWLHKKVDVIPDPHNEYRAAIFDGPLFIGIAHDVARQMNAGRLSVADAQIISAELRVSQQRKLRSAIPMEVPHTVPLIEASDEISPIEFHSTEQPLPQTTEDLTDYLSDEAKALLDTYNL